MICQMPVITGFECKRIATRIGKWNHNDGVVIEHPLCDHHAKVAPNATRAHFTTRPITQEASPDDIR